MNEAQTLNNVSVEILNKEEFNADYFGDGRYLIGLGGCSDYGNDDDLGLGDWAYQFEVLVTNKDGETQQFTIVYQPVERNNGMMNYSGYGITTAGSYGNDADMASELERFCDYDTIVLDTLHEIAAGAAKIEFERLMKLFRNGEIESNQDFVL